jgi:hypothetical protein
MASLTKVHFLTIFAGVVALVPMKLLESMNCEDYPANTVMTVHSGRRKDSFVARARRVSRSVALRLYWLSLVWLLRLDWPDLVDMCEEKKI